MKPLSPRMVAVAMVLLIATAAFSGSSNAQNVATTFDLLRQLYGLNQAPRCTEVAATIGTTATRQLKNDPSRVSFEIVNTGSIQCYFAHNPNVSATASIPLAYNGGFYAEDFRTDMLGPTEEGWILCTAAGGTLFVRSCHTQ